MFKSTQTVDDDDNVIQQLTWRFGEIEKLGLGNTKEARKALIDHDFKKSLEQGRYEFDAFNQAVERNMASGMQYADAMTNARQQVNFTSQALREHCDELAELYKTEGDATKRQEQVNASWDAYSAKQKKAQEESQKTQKGFKALSTSTKAMLGNIGLDLLAGLAIQGLQMAWNATDEKLALTAKTKIEHMEKAVNEYNEAVSSSSENISTIKSLSAEYERLAQGVDANGRNIGLSADEFERYNEASFQSIIACALSNSFSFQFTGCY